MQLTLEMALLRVGLGPAFLAPKRRFMMGGEDSEIRRGCFVFLESLSERYGGYCRETVDA